MPATYAYSAWFFLRFLSLVYLIAFASVAWQARGLWGAHGVLPIASYLEAVQESVGASCLLVHVLVFTGSG